VCKSVLESLLARMSVRERLNGPYVGSRKLSMPCRGQGKGKGSSLSMTYTRVTNADGKVIKVKALAACRQRIVE